MKMKIMKTILSVAVLTAITSNTWAAGTAADTDIDNTASISYSVGGAGQTAIESSETGNSTPGVGNGAATTFKVDKKIDLLVTGAASNANAIPGAIGQPITFTVTNEGNSTENFSLTPTGSVAANTFDSTACAVTIPAVLPVSIAPDAQTTVTVECTMAAASAIVINGATTEVDLLAEVDGAAAQAAADAIIPDNPATVQTVLVDDTGTTTDGSDYNAQHSATSTFVINTAQITVAKTSTVTADPTGGANPKRIPGATIEYAITVTNAATPAVTATGIVISDILPAGTTGTTATSAGVSFSSCSIVAPGLAVGDCLDTGGTVTSSSFDLAPGATATLTIVATVN